MGGKYTSPSASSTIGLNMIQCSDSTSLTINGGLKQEDFLFENTLTDSDAKGFLVLSKDQIWMPAGYIGDGRPNLDACCKRKRVVIESRNAAAVKAKNFRLFGEDIYVECTNSTSMIQSASVGCGYEVEKYGNVGVYSKKWDRNRPGDCRLSLRAGCKSECTLVENGNTVQVETKMIILFGKKIYAESRIDANGEESQIKSKKEQFGFLVKP